MPAPGRRTGGAARQLDENGLELLERRPQVFHDLGGDGIRIGQG